MSTLLINRSTKATTTPIIWMMIFVQFAKAISTQNTVRNVTGYIAPAVFWLHKDCTYENFHCDKC